MIEIHHGLWRKKKVKFIKWPQKESEIWRVIIKKKQSLILSKDSDSEKDKGIWVNAHLAIEYFEIHSRKLLEFLNYWDPWSMSNSSNFFNKRNFFL